MYSTKKARSEDAGENLGNTETGVSRTGRPRVTQEDAKNPKPGSKWKESVLEKWRGALVKARLALRKKREKKKEQHVKSRLARLGRTPDATRKPQEEDNAPQKQSLKKRGRPPLAGRVGKAQVLAAVATKRTSTKILKKAKTTSGGCPADDGDLNEPIPSVTVKKRGRKPSARTTTDLDEANVAELRAEMERKEEIRNKWRNALQIARSALKQKRERRKEMARKASIRRRRRSQDEAVQDNIAQVGFSLKRPSLEELRNFAKKSRSQVCNAQTLSNPGQSCCIHFGGRFLM